VKKLLIVPLLFLLGYTALYDFGEALSELIGFPHLATSVLLFAATAVSMTAAIRRKSAAADFLNPPAPEKRLAYLSPLLLFAILNLIFADRSPGKFSLSETILMVVSACAEEMIFRAVLLSREQRYPMQPVTAALLNALVFSLLHLGNISVLGAARTVLQVISAFSAGFLLSAFALSAGSIFPGLLLHVLINATGSVPPRSTGLLYFCTWLPSALLALAAGLLLLRKETKP